MDYLAMKQAIINALTHKVSVLEKNNEHYFVQIEDSNLIMNALASALQLALDSYENGHLLTDDDIAYSREVLKIYSRYHNDLPTVDKVTDLHNQIVKLVSRYND